MKHLKKLASTALALLMVAAMMIPAFAADGDSTTYQIKITGDKLENHDFAAFQIFKGTPSVDTKSLENVEWGASLPTDKRVSFIQELQKGLPDVKVIQDLQLNADDSYAITVARAINTAGDNKTVAQAVADAAAKVVNKNAPVKSADKKDVSATQAVINGLDSAGYYLVTDTLNGVAKKNIMLPVLTTVATIAVKPDDLPDFNKEVKEFNQNTWGNAASYPVDSADAVNKKVEFKLTATLKGYEGNSSYKLVFHDQMNSEQLSGFEIGSVTVAGKSLDKSDYVLETNVSHGEGQTEPYNENCSFHITINDLVALAAQKEWKLTNSDQVVVTYTATLQNNAVLGGDGNRNRAWLETNGDPTPPKDVYVYSFKLDITKLDGAAAEANTPLSGAGFTLYRLDNNVDGSAGWVKLGDERVTGDTGKIDFEKLAAGYYKLEETTIPSGYTQMPTLYFTIDPTYDANGKLTGLTATEKTPGKDDTKKAEWVEKTGEKTQFTRVDDDVAENSTVTIGSGIKTEITNRKGVVLPATGGIGTTIFYIAGGILAVGAVILLVTKRRMGQED